MCVFTCVCSGMEAHMHRQCLCAHEGECVSMHACTDRCVYGCFMNLGIQVCMCVCVCVGGEIIFFSW